MTLIDPATLRAKLASDNPPVVLDARWSGPAATVDEGHKDFEAGHIPGSLWVSMNKEMSNPDVPGGRHPLPDPGAFEAEMRRKGLNEDSSVVVLDGGNSLAAGRLWWLLTDGGLTDVQVLNGGFAAWKAAGYPVETGPTWSSKVGDIMLRAGHLERVDAKHLLANAGTLWDVRSPERYRGDEEPIDPKAGHIPGARNLPATEAQEPDGTFKSPDELKKVFAAVKPGDAVYCGSGITASQALLAMHVAGINGVKLYPGSWSDWISDDSRPVERG
ncbi:MAG: sulfurtransferase [Propionibacterium freudenreichii]